MATPTFQVTTASPAHSTIADVEHIQPMHVAPADQAQLPHGTGVEQQGHAPMNLGAKNFLMKKMAANGGSFHSPTDTMVSPCTKKLTQTKQRHYTKGKPLSLSSSFQSQVGQQQPGAKPKSSLGQSSTMGENASPF
ncbi:hypothetical protein JCM21900_000130 [Sporobolomyces salmonicolor]